ncbi:MAG: single-stranded-DNA-specific exonuclease RecJ [Ardenticatenaceae bacterium]
MERLWSIQDPAPESHFECFADLPRPVAQLLFNRGLKDRAQAEAFFGREVEESNPFRMRGMFETVKRIRQAIELGEKVIVHGDYDADGVTSTAVMVTGLYALGAKVAPYIPHRAEGYGLNKNTIHKLKKHDISLMITVDCGIRAKEQIALANELGIEVIVTDHHSPGETLPEALAIVNPHQPGCEYPYKHLAGVGLAWKTVLALWLAERKSPLGKVRQPLNPNELLDLVALGTVADVAPLTGENRSLVWRGLNQLRHTERPGLLALMASAGIKPPAVSAESIAFFLGPRINATGRIDHAIQAYYLLRARDMLKAGQLADELELKNRERQKMTKQSIEHAHTKLPDPTAPLLMVSDPSCPHGIVGLVAGRLLEEFYRPTIVLSEEEEFSRASCRSIPEFHITRALEQVSDMLERFGGHAAAAGFTVRTKKIPELNEALLAIAAEQLNGGIKSGELRPRLVADAMLPLAEVNDRLVDALEKLAPFGEANREPIWMCHNVKVQDARQVGRNKTHLQLTLMDKNARRWRAIAFRLGNRYKGLPREIDIAFSVKRSEWQGRQRLELQVSDFRASQKP